MSKEFRPAGRMSRGVHLGLGGAARGRVGFGDGRIQQRLRPFLPGVESVHKDKKLIFF